MKSVHLATLAACAIALGGCVTDGPATNGKSLRNIVASQIVAPAPQAQRQPAGIDGAAAVETYKNYVDSYNSPRPQLNDSAFRR